MSRLFELEIEVLEGRNIPHTGPNEAILLQSAFAGRACETQACSVKTQQGRISWLNGKGKLVWSLSEARLDKLRATAPCVKLNLVTKPASIKTVGGTFLGYALLSIKPGELSVAKDGHFSFEGWVPLAGLHDAHLKLTATLREIHVLEAQAQDEAHSATVAPSSIAARDTASERTRSPSRGAPLSRAPELALDAVPVGDRGARRYYLTISLRRIMGISFIAPPQPVTDGGGTIAWLSYRLFGVLVETRPFSARSLDDATSTFSATTDTFVLKSCLPDMALFLTSLPPLQIFLLSKEGPLGVAELHLSRLIDAMPASCHPVRMLDAVSGQVERGAADMDAASEEVFGGSEMEGGFTIHMQHGASSGVGLRKAVLDAAVTLKPADDSEILSVAQPHDGPVVIGDVQRSGWPNVAPSLTILPDPVYGAASSSRILTSTALNVVPSTRNMNVYEDIAWAVEEPPSAPVVAGLLFMQPVELCIVSLQLLVRDRSDETISARVRLQYTTTFVPPGATGTGQVLHQEYTASDIAVLGMTWAETEDRSEQQLSESIILQLPAEFMPSRDLDNKETPPVPVTAPGDVVFYVLDDDGDSSTGAAAAEGRLPASAIAAAASLRCVGGRIVSIPVYPTDVVAGTPSIGTLLVRICSSGEAEDKVVEDESFAKVKAVGTASVDRPHVPMVRATSSGESSTSSTQTVANSGTQTELGTESVFKARTVQVTAPPLRQQKVTNVDLDRQVAPVSPLKQAVGSGNVSSLGGGDQPPPAAQAQPAIQRPIVPVAPPALAVAPAPAPPVFAHQSDITGLGVPIVSGPAIQSMNVRPAAVAVNPYGKDVAQRRWRLSVDLRSIRDVAKAGAYFVRFGYQALSAAVAQDATDANALSNSAQTASVPILRTRPAVQLAQGTERLLPSSFASFTFIMSGRRLTQLFKDSPLAVELCLAGSNEGSEDASLGTAIVPLGDLIKLAPVLRCPITHRTFAVEAEYEQHANALRAAGQHSNAAIVSLACPALMRVLDVRLPVSSQSDRSPTRPAASLRVVAFLDDMGTVDPVSAGSAHASMLNDSTASASCAERFGDLLIAGSALLGDGSKMSMQAPLTANTGIVTPRATVAPQFVDGGKNGDDNAISRQFQPSETGVSSNTVLADSLITLPAVRSQVDALVARIVAREEDALVAWRKESEEGWVRAKIVAEETWRREAEERERARMQVLEAAWADREAERQAVLAEAQERVREAESRLRRLASVTEARLRDAEKAKDDAARGEDIRLAEMAALQKRLREDTEHALQLCKQRESAAAQRVSEAQTDAEGARSRALELESSLGDARKAVLTSPNEALRDAVAVAEAEIGSVRLALADASVQVESERVAKEEARVQVLRLAQELARLREAAAAEKEAALQRMRVAWLAREERYVLDGDRDALRDIRRAADAVRDASSIDPLVEGRAQQIAGSHGTYLQPVPPSASDRASMAADAGISSVSLHERNIPLGVTSAAIGNVGAILGTAIAGDMGTYDSSDSAARVVDRLKAERRALLASGHPYTAGHPLVRRIDRALHAAETAMRTLKTQGR